jgi:hypothetical protein
MTSGPYTIDEKGNKSDARIWASEMNEEQEEDFDYYVYLRTLHAAVKAEIKKREDLRNEIKTTNNQQPTE